MENCFWDRVQSLDGVSCVIPSFMTKEANVTKPECQDAESKRRYIQKLRNFENSESENEWRNCKCLKRCKLVDYRVSVDPAFSSCDSIVKSFKGEGAAFLFFSFPSNRVCVVFRFPSFP